MNMVQYLPYAWPITAVVTLCVGLAAFGVNILKTLQLDSFRKSLQYVAGLFGLVSLITWFCNRHDVGIAYPVKGDAKLASAIWFITALVALAVGLAACGCDLLKTCKIGSFRKPLQYVAGVVGAYSLICYFGIL